MKPLIFYLLSAFILIFSILTVSAKKIFRSAIFLLLALVGIAAVYFLMDYSFLAVVQLIIYAGGIVVLILFSILLTHEINTSLPAATMIRRAASGFLAFAGFLFSYFLLSNYSFPANGSAFAALTGAATEPDIKTIGLQLMSINQFGFILPFEVVSILLLAALIGCIVVAMKSK